jgi:hypothetical protein
MGHAFTKDDLSGFIGSETRFRHSLVRRFLYTEGVKFFAEKAGAYWFLDVCATELHQLCFHEGFLAIRLEVANSKAVATADDGNRNDLWTKEIDLTDCPEGLWKFYMAPGDETHSVMMLPSEY